MNDLLAALPPKDLSLLVPHLSPWSFERGQTIYAPRDALTHIYFPDSGIIGASYEGKSRHTIIELIGRDSYAGLPAILHAKTAAALVVAVVEGTGQKISVEVVIEACDKSRTLRRVMLQAARLSWMQTAQSLVARSQASVEIRTARLLLMLQDRMDLPALPFTQEQLGKMLGVRRASVTVALLAFQEKRLIERRGNGHFCIADRQGLMRLAGEYYSPPDVEAALLFGVA